MTHVALAGSSAGIERDVCDVGVLARMIPGGERLVAWWDRERPAAFAAALAPQELAQLLLLRAQYDTLLAVTRVAVVSQACSRTELAELHALREDLAADAASLPRPAGTVFVLGEGGLDASPFATSLFRGETGSL